MPQPEVPGARPLFLSHLYVDRPFLGRGVGKTLMLRCVDEARRNGDDVLWLGVWDRNARAIAFYARWGFEQVGEGPFVFGDDVHRDLVLALEVGSSS